MTAERDALLAQLRATVPGAETAEGRESLVNAHIKKLHTYNEAKDAAQILIGRAAEMEHTTAKEMHTRFDVDGLEE
ncbi:hypothetical protein CXG81DRAFT_13915 [Caulochytrium protostelioides]|uniref:Swi5-domain-containing protein n=1 Tax=Caulochytrium protostelioides TaxID=1555241 RepID=A0A4P9X491_9FUNG|nr:hypothetical protein CXG81DRAFT_13915 [Caulochytrium protostelioides]|eukprot:RKO99886.1 hypothetical protein CXG81DRAFT_13915 [Caulochytrium protostelioides]